MRLKTILAVAVVSVLSVEVQAQEKVLAFAAHGNLTLFVGKWNPTKGWVDADAFYQPPDPGSLVTLFGPTGKVTEVVIADPRRAPASSTPQEWSASITHWQSAGGPYALAVIGNWPSPAREAQSLPLDDSEAKKVVSDFLKTRKLDVPDPFLTQHIRIDLDGDGQPEEFIAAHSDESTLRDDQPAVVYAVALVQAKGRTWPLGAETSFKPARRSLDEHNHLHGTRDFYRWVAFTDLNDDGRLDVTLYRAATDATAVDIFSYDPSGFKKVLSAYRGF